jgi:hypothetical protein
MTRVNNRLNGFKPQNRQTPEDIFQHHIKVKYAKTSPSYLQPMFLIKLNSYIRSLSRIIVD